MMPLFSPVLFVGLRVDQGIAAMVQTIGIMDVVRSDSRRPLTISAIELGRLWDVLEQDGGAKMLPPVRRGPWFKKDRSEESCVGEEGVRTGRSRRVAVYKT